MKTLVLLIVALMFSACSTHNHYLPPSETEYLNSIGEFEPDYYEDCMFHEGECQ